MNFFPYGFSKDEVYEFLGNVKDLEFFAFVIGPLAMLNILVHGLYEFVFDYPKNQRAEHSLTPLVAKLIKTSKRVMTFLHVILFLNGISHFFNVGWVVTILWYPMWITLYFIKISTEMYTIVISLFSISRYFLHYSLAQPSTELTQPAVKSGMSLVSAWMFLKDLVLFVWLIVVFETKNNGQITTISDYYYGIHLCFQLFLYMSASLQLPIICGSGNRVEPSHAEKLIYHQTVGIALSKLILILVLFYLGSRGINSDVLKLIFISADLLVVSIVVQISEVLGRKGVVQAARREEVEMGSEM
uniref:Uncharacterized protein n=2 Tax=Caenorhabditis tropicalis TaxID=1561998 RepID=A0A1I7V2D0_9PELO